MTTLTETKHAGEHVISLAQGDRSQEVVTVQAGQVLDVGHVVGKVTAGGQLTEWDPGNVDGSEVVVGVMFDAVDATGGDKPGVMTARDAELDAALLAYFTGADATAKAAAKEGLAALGIVLH